MSLIKKCPVCNKKLNRYVENNKVKMLCECGYKFEKDIPKN